ncbi:MAG: hypothetical protein AAGD13_03445 [Pseudomonadota bacterium]
MILLFAVAVIAVIYLVARADERPVERKVRVRVDERPKRRFDVIDE